MIAYDTTPYEIFNLAKPQTTTLSALIAQIEAVMGKKAGIARQPMQPGDVSVSHADISKARRMRGYEPHTQIAEGIPKFVE